MNFNFDFDIVMILALFTLGTVLVIGIVSRQRAKKAQDHHEGAAAADNHRTPDDADGDDAGRTWSKERGANPPTPTNLPPD